MFISKITLYAKKNQPVFLAVLLAGALVVVQILFLWIQESNAKRDQTIIESILRDENRVYNPYQLSRTLTDLSKTNFISCVSLIESGSNLSYFTANGQSADCRDSRFYIDGIFTKIKLSSINGVDWDISYKSVNPRVLILSLWFSRVLACLIVCIAFILVRKEIVQLQLLRELECVEKNRVQTLAKQTAHDLGSPFSAIKILSRKAKLSKEEIGLLKLAVARSEGIVKSLKANAKNYSSSGQAIWSVSDLIDEVLGEKQIEKGVLISYEIAEKSQFLIEINKIEFGRVLSNILNNAIEATEGLQGPVVCVSPSSKRSFVDIEVADKGMGIAPSQLPHIFQKGVSTKPGGQGLGLYHANNFVKAAGGVLIVKSKLSEGTRVLVRLPLVTKETGEKSVKAGLRNSS